MYLLYDNSVNIYESKKKLINIINKVNEFKLLTLKNTYSGTNVAEWLEDLWIVYFSVVCFAIFILIFTWCVAKFDVTFYKLVGRVEEGNKMVHKIQT